MSDLEDLIAFNDELASLARAGIPIDLGLSQVSHDSDAANKQINAAIAESVDDGVSLHDAVFENSSLPPIYQSVVSAGLQCGDLSAGLDALSRYSRSLNDVGQSLGSALVYPIIICGLTYLLFVSSCLFVSPESFQQLAGTDSIGGAVYDVLQMLRNSLAYWVAIPPVLLIALIFIGYRTSGISKTFGWIPGVSDIKADQLYASFAELLAMLVEHNVSMDEGLELAARASGDSKLASAAQQLATDLQRGESLSPDAEPAGQFPPFLCWALTSQTEASDLSSTLRLAAETYRSRAERRAKWLCTATPTLTCIVLAGGITLLYCLSIFVPFIQLIKDLS